MTPVGPSMADEIEGLIQPPDGDLDDDDMDAAWRR